MIRICSLSPVRCLEGAPSGRRSSYWNAVFPLLKKALDLAGNLTTHSAYVDPAGSSSGKRARVVLANIPGAVPPNGRPEKATRTHLSDSDRLAISIATESFARTDPYSMS